MSNIFTPLTLPNGQNVPNRLCKAAMEENMTEPGQVPGTALVNLYKSWAAGAPGMILTGNVMIDPTAMTGAGGVVLEHGTLDDANIRQKFEAWAEAGKSGGSKLVMQISHPGRQIYAAQGTQPVSASATKLNMGSPAANKMFGQARALESDEIRGVIRRFAETSLAAQSAGFEGVQIHAAHGYLLAQFLSPLTNLRTDEWGGPLENRARLLLEVIRAIRARVDDSFIVGVKLNSADFQKGGFDVEDARQVVDWLNGEAVDFVEISGGSYESAAMMGNAADGRLDSTARREIYFLDFAKDIAKTAKMPLMVTGGVTKRKTADMALAEDGVDMVGIARAMAYHPNLPADWKSGQNLTAAVAHAKLKNNMLAGLATMAMTKSNLYRIGAGKAPKPSPQPILSLIAQQIRQSTQTKRYRAWLVSKGHTLLD